MESAGYLLTVAAWMACLVWTGEAWSWGAADHETVGAIAGQLIAGTAAAACINAILGMDLKKASVWADCVKRASMQDGSFH